MAADSLVSEPQRQDSQRISRLEQQVQALFEGQEQVLKRLSEMMDKIDGKTDGREEEFVNRGREGRKEGTPGGTPGASGVSLQTRFMKLEFPKFQGTDDPTSWLLRAEQFFVFQNMPAEEQVRIAAFHLEQDTQIWYQRKRRIKPRMDWEEFKKEIMKRFGDVSGEEAFGELSKLRQTSSVKDYYNKFDKLLARVGELSEQQEATLFISGLKDYIKADVKAQRPKTLSAAIGLARIFEESGTKEVKWGYSKKRGEKGEEKIGVGGAFVTKKLTPEEIQQRKEKGLCFHCDEKYTFNYQCKRLFRIEIFQDFNDEWEEPGEEAENNQEEPRISLHALSGTDSPQTLRVRGRIKVKSSLS